MVPRAGLHSTLPVSAPGSVPKRLWELGKLNHVAIAVPDIEKATALYRDVLGAKVSEMHVSLARLRLL